uniref:Uncharacterized protein n=1 Tax=Rhizophora mucronata TaxID=61149 RepID=A0A2P2NSN9_RHIMU
MSREAPTNCSHQASKDCHGRSVDSWGSCRLVVAAIVDLEEIAPSLRKAAPEDWPVGIAY